MAPFVCSFVALPRLLVRSTNSFVPSFLDFDSFVPWFWFVRSVISIGSFLDFDSFVLRRISVVFSLVSWLRCFVGFHAFVTKSLISSCDFVFFMRILSTIFRWFFRSMIFDCFVWRLSFRLRSAVRSCVCSLACSVACSLGCLVGCLVVLCQDDERPFLVPRSERDPRHHRLGQEPTVFGGESHEGVGDTTGFCRRRLQYL